MNQDFKNALWATANKLRGAVDPAEYKYPVLGLIFLKYVSESFAARQAELTAAFADPKNEFYLDDEAMRASELEERDYYRASNTFWVPEKARWSFIQANAKQPNIAVLLDDAMRLVEEDNPKLANLLPKVYVRTTLEQNTLGTLIDLVASIDFGQGEHKGDVLGDVYEYFLGNFAGAEGKNAGEFYTTSSIVNIIVEVLAPKKGKLFDPACGAGGMFVSTKKFSTAHGGRVADLSIYGQERNPNTWKIAAMNLAIRGLDFNLGQKPGDTFTEDQHPDLKADYILMNPPFGAGTEWSKEALTNDPRWVYGIPPAKPAHFAWLQHALYHMSSRGQAGIVMPNGTLTTTQGGEDIIRKRMIEDDVVECIIAMPSQLFLNTQIPCCLWFFARDKTKNGRNRRGETLFIDARKLGYMKDRVNRAFTDEDIQKIAQTVHLWREDEDNLPATENQDKQLYIDIPGFCKSATLEEIREMGFVLSPGRYCGTELIEDDDELFHEKMTSLCVKLNSLFEQSDSLRQKLQSSLQEIGYGK